MFGKLKQRSNILDDAIGVFGLVNGQKDSHLGLLVRVRQTLQRPLYYRSFPFESDLMSDIFPKRFAAQLPTLEQEVCKLD